MRRITRVLAAALSIALGAQTAHGHANLLQCSPAAGSVVMTAPQEIRLKFNEPVAVKLSGVDVTTQEGGKIAAGPVEAVSDDRTELAVPIKGALSPGTYLVRWHVVSADMHKIKGDFVFEVRP